MMRALAIIVICIVLNGAGFVTYRSVKADADTTVEPQQIAPLPATATAPAPERIAPIIAEPVVENASDVKVETKAEVKAEVKTEVMADVKVDEPATPPVAKRQPPRRRVLEQPAKPAPAPAAPAAVETKPAVNESLLKMDANPYKRGE